MRDKHNELYPDEPNVFGQYQGIGDERVRDITVRAGRSTPWYARMNANGKAVVILPMMPVLQPGRVVVQDLTGLHEYDALATDKWRSLTHAERIQARRSFPGGIEVPGDNNTYRAIRHRGFNGDRISQDPAALA